MPSLMIKCPTTQKLIPTGIAADKVSFESGQFSNNAVKCSACGQMHIGINRTSRPKLGDLTRNAADHDSQPVDLNNAAEAHVR